MGFRGSVPSSQSLVASPWLRISRASQLDAAQIDQANISLLKEQLKKVFSMMPSYSKIEPELMALLHFLVWRFSIWMDKPTPGNASKNLRYRDDGAFQSLLSSGKVRTGLEGPGLSTLQKIGYLLFMVSVPYCWSRLQSHDAFVQQDIVVKGMRYLERIFKVANLANFLIFLNTGRYRALADRLLKARLVYQKPNIVHVTPPELFNRELVWGELSDLLLIFLPVLGRVLNWFRCKWSSAKAIAAKDTCIICAAKPITLPYVARPCGHLYCYYCLSARCSAFQRFRCPCCNQEVVSMERFKDTEETMIPT